MPTKEIGLRIKAARKRAGLTQDELGRKLGVSRPAVAQWEAGKTLPNTKKLDELSRALGLPDLELFHAGALEGEGSDGASTMVSVRTVPELSWAQAASRTESERMAGAAQARRWPSPVACSDKAFALKVESEAMSPRFPPGTLIVVDPEIRPASGSKVLALLGGGVAAFREYSEDESGRRMLKALNPAWPEPYTMMSDEDEVIGGVVFAGFEV